MKLTYWIKTCFLFLSWMILFNGLEAESIDEATFFTSLLIYTGAIVFDLIFLCIETHAKTNFITECVYVTGIGLIIVNSFFVFIELIGAMHGINVIVNEKNLLVMQIANGGITRVFGVLNKIKFEISYFMILILVFGILSIIPGLFLIRAKKKYQENNQS